MPKTTDNNKTTENNRKQPENTENNFIFSS